MRGKLKPAEDLSDTDLQTGPEDMEGGRKLRSRVRREILPLNSEDEYEDMEDGDGLGSGVKMTQVLPSRDSSLPPCPIGREGLPRPLHGSSGFNSSK